RAVSAAHSAALPPPTTATSVSMICSTTPCNPISSAQLGRRGSEDASVADALPRSISKPASGVSRNSPGRAAVYCIQAENNEPGTYQRGVCVGANSRDLRPIHLGSAELHYEAARSSFAK